MKNYAINSYETTDELIMSGIKVYTSIRDRLKIIPDDDLEKANNIHYKALCNFARYSIGTSNYLGFAVHKKENKLICFEFPQKATSDLCFDLQHDDNGFYLETI